MTDKEQGFELHKLLLSGDVLALAKLYDIYGENIMIVLRKKYPKISQADESILHEAVNEAFLGYNSNPNTYNPDKKSLKSFLIMAAERDLLNLLNRYKNQGGKIKLPNNVELEENLWNSIKKDTNSTDESIIQKEIFGLVEIELRKYFLIDKDLELAKMIIRGEKETKAFAIVLEIDGLETDKQQEEVKRNKDRIKKVIERNQIELKLKKLLQ